MDNALVTLIGNVGFPIAVTAFLLVRLEQRLASLEQSIGKLTVAIIEREAVHVLGDTVKG